MDSFTVRRLSFTENVNALRDRTVDAAFWVVAPGTSSIMDLATTHDIQLISFTPEQQKKVAEAYAFYSPWEMEGGVYKGVTTSTPTISVWNVIICQKSLSEDLVYELTKVLFEQNEYMQKIHPFARYTTPENAVSQTPIPIHPGAAKFLKEQGISVPANLMP